MAINLATPAKTRHPNRRVNIGICMPPGLAAVVDRSAVPLGCNSISHLFRVAVVDYLLKQEALPDEIKAELLIATQDAAA